MGVGSVPRRRAQTGSAGPGGQQPARETDAPADDSWRRLVSLARPALVVSGVLLLIFLVGRLRAAQQLGAPDNPLHDAGLWPVGLGAGLVLLASTRLQCHAALAAVGLVTLGTGLSAGFGAPEALTLAVAATVEAYVVTRLVARDEDGRPRLVELADLLRLVRAGVAAGAAGAVIDVVAVASGLTDQALADAGGVAVVVAMTHLISHVLVLPFFMRVPQSPPTAGRGEVVVQSALVALVIPALFIPDVRGLVFLVFTVLAWGATRCGFRVAMAQPVVLTVLASQLTINGWGPFAAQAGTSSAVLGIVLLQGYALCIVAVVLPLALTIAQQHRRTQEVLQERQRAEGLVRSTVGTAIVATDQTGAVLLANPGALELFGYDAETLSMLSVDDLFPGGELVAQAEELGVEPELVSVMEAMSDLGGERREWVVRRGDGEPRAHLLGFARLLDDQDCATGYVLTSEDITERIQLQESLTTALAAERAVVARMEELDNVKEALVSSVSHELRTPVTSILGFVELLSDGDFGRLTDDQAQAVRRVSENGSRLLTLIDDLLGLARMQEGVMRLELRPLDLREVVHAAWAVLEGRVNKRTLTVDLQLPDEPALVEGDRDALERLLVNLVGNALKFTPDGGRVVVRLHRLGDRLAIDVSDTGIGIPLEEQDKLFGRFFRSSTAAENAIQGTGLGLSIVKAIAEQHGGGVSVESALGEGSTFRVDLPASWEVHRAEPGSLPAPVASTPASVLAVSEPAVREEPVESAPVPATPGPAPAVEPVEATPVPAAAAAQPGIHAESAGVDVHAETVGVDVHAESAGVGCEDSDESGTDGESVESLLAVLRAAATTPVPSWRADAPAASDGQAPAGAVPDAASVGAGSVTVAAAHVAAPGDAAAPPAASNGAASNGAASNGAASNGAASNGAASNGAVSNGAAHELAPPDETSEAPAALDPDRPPAHAGGVDTLEPASLTTGDGSDEPPEDPRQAAARRLRNGRPASSAASRLAAAREAAGGGGSGDAARAILDAFGPRPSR